MPTISKFYLHDTALGLAGTLPGAASLSAVSPTVAATGDSTNRMMDAVIGASQAAVTINTSAVTTAQTAWFRRFCSWPLAAQTLASGTWTLQLGASESSANANFLMFFRLYVWRPSTGATVATLISASSNSVEPGTTETNTSTTGSQAAGAAILNGDILVVEVWGSSTQAKASVFTETINYDGTAEGSTTTNAAFLTPPAAVTLLSYVHDTLMAVEQAINRAASF